MPIKLNYQPITAIGVGAAVGGYGQFLGRERDRNTQRELTYASLTAQQQRERERMLYSAQQAELDRRQQLRRDALGIAADREQYQQTLARDERGYQQQVDLQGLRVAGQMQVADYQLSAAQRAKKAELEAKEQAIYDAHRKGQLNDEQLAVALGQHQMGVDGWKAWVQQTAPPDTQLDEEIGKRVKPVDGGLLVMQPDGKLEFRPKPAPKPPAPPKPDPNVPTRAEYGKLYNDLYDKMTVEKQDEQGNPKMVPPTPEAVADRIRKIDEAYRKEYPQAQAQMEQPQRQQAGSQGGDLPVDAPQQIKDSVRILQEMISQYGTDLSRWPPDELELAKLHKISVDRYRADPELFSRPVSVNR